MSEFPEVSEYFSTIIPNNIKNDIKMITNNILDYASGFSDKLMLFKDLFDDYTKNFNITYIDDLINSRNELSDCWLELFGVIFENIRQLKITLNISEEEEEC
jgi:hypothetical protein